MDEEELGAPPARQRDRSLSKTLASAASGVSSLARETWWGVGDRLEHTARRVNGWAEYNVVSVCSPRLRTHLFPFSQQLWVGVP